MEYRKWCKVYGCIWCYSDQDLKTNARNVAFDVLSAVGTIAIANPDRHGVPEENQKIV